MLTKILPHNRLKTYSSLYANFIKDTPFKLQLRKAIKTDFAKKSLLNILLMSIYIKILFLHKDQEDLGTAGPRSTASHGDALPRGVNLASPVFTCLPGDRLS